MSRTMGLRVPRDEYLTPRPLVEAVVKKLKQKYPNFDPMNCLEPGCAWGVHLDYAVDYFSSIVHSVGVDILEQPINSDHEFVCTDFLTWKPDERFDLIISNPPFGIAEQCFLKAQSLLTSQGICLLFERIGFLASGRRTQGYKENGVWCPGLWTQINLREVWVCGKRPAMIGQVSTDACEYGYFLFDSSFVHGPVYLDWLYW